MNQIIMQALYILLAILIFGVLIFIHEFGHFITARMFGVNVIEFAIGMGPKIFQKRSKKTDILYTLRLFPIGGFVNMGEDDIEAEGEELPPNSFRKKPVWQRFIIVAAGAVMNILLGIIVMSAIVISSDVLASPTVAKFDEGAISCEHGLAVGDTVLEINGASVHTAEEIAYEIMYNGYEPLDILVKRNGEKILLEDISFPTFTEDGMTGGEMDFGVYVEEKTFLNVVKHAVFRSGSTIKMIWQSFTGLLTGRFGVEQVSGPVGITGAITDAAAAGGKTLAYFFVVITMNLGVFNLIPIPALDGGRLFFLLIEFFRRKPVNPKYEAYVNFAGLCVLMVFIIFVSIKDVISLF